VTREELLVGLTELLETNLPLTGLEELSSLGNWDSMAVISLMAMADDRCGVTLAPRKINSCKTVDDLVQLVLRAIEQPTPASLT
jgi:acyl carrier protein